MPPFYDYKCKCEEIRTLRKSIANRDERLVCNKCGEEIVRQISAPPLLYSSSSRDVKATDQTNNVG